MRLKIIHPDGEEQYVQLHTDQPLRLGTHRAADIVLRGAGVFPVHFGVTFRQGSFRAVASKSSKTIRINGNKVPAASLKIGDRIDAGQTRIQIVDDQIDVQPSPESDLEALSTDDIGLDAGLAPLDEALDMLADGALENEYDPLNDPAGQQATVASAALDDGRRRSSKKRRGVEQAERAERGPSVLARVVRSVWFRAGVAVLVFVPLAWAFWFYYQQLPTAKERFEQADQLYRDGQLVESADAFDRFLTWHRRSEWASEARVKRDVARLKLALKRGEDPAALLTQTEQVVEQWDALASLPVAQNGLVEVLPGIVLDQLNAGIAAMDGNAHQVAGSAFADAARGLELIDRFVPSQIQQSQGIDQLKIRLAVRQRALNQNELLRKTLAQIQQVGKQSGMVAAYVPLDQLLAEYPNLAVSGRINSAFRQLAVAETERVVLQRIENQPDVLPASSSTTSTEPAPKGSSTDSNETVAVPARYLGMLYGLDAATGKVRWQVELGLGTDVLPVPVTDQRSSDILVVEPVTERVSRVDVRTGRPRWRVAVGPVASLSRVVGQHIIAATRDRRLVVLDVTTGRPQWQMQLPQQPVGLVVDGKSERCYAVAERGVIYVVSISQKRCLSVYYLGHAYKAATIRPVLFQDQLLVIEQTGPASSHLHLLGGGSPLARTQVVPFPARVMGVPVVRGRSLFLTGSDGKLYQVRWNETRRSEPLKVVRSVPMFDAGTWDSQLVFITHRAGNLWTSGKGVTRWQVTSDDAAPKVIAHLEPVLEVAQPMILTGSDLICVGRQEARPGLIARAWDVEKGDLHWSSASLLPAAAKVESDPGLSEEAARHEK